MLAVLSLRKSQKSPLPSQWFKRLLLFISISSLAACDQAPTPGEAVLQHTLGQNVAKLQVQTLDGAPQPFTDLIPAGTATPVVLNIWATWCTPCLVEMPTLDALGRSGRARVVAIATDPSATVVKDFLRNQHWGRGIEIWHDPRGIITREALSAKALPSTYVLNPSLTIIYAVAGERDWADWQPGQRPR